MSTAHIPLHDDPAQVLARRAVGAYLYTLRHGRMTQQALVDRIRSSTLARKVSIKDIYELENGLRLAGGMLRTAVTHALGGSADDWDAAITYAAQLSERAGADADLDRMADAARAYGRQLAEQQLQRLEIQALIEQTAAEVPPELREQALAILQALADDPSKADQFLEFGRFLANSPRGGKHENDG